MLHRKPPLFNTLQRQRVLNIVFGDWKSLLQQRKACLRRLEQSLKSDFACSQVQFPTAAALVNTLRDAPDYDSGSWTRSPPMRALR